MPTEDSRNHSVPTKPEEAPPQADFFETMAFGRDTPVAEPAAEVQSAVVGTPGPAAASPNVPAAAAAPNVSAAAAPALPSAFGRYEVRSLLGTGGFGAVYLGHDAQLERSVAIKVLHAGTSRQGVASDAFLQEARKLARLRHAGIVTVHDVGVHEGQVFLVSDYLDGPDLGRWMQGNQVAWPEAARIVAAVADALAHAHAHLIVHRDVKPTNIILTADRAPVLVDFGLALDEAQAGGSEKGRLSGTPAYLSPEQAMGTAHRIDGRTDIYSLAAVLYELLTGRVPFRAPHFLEQLRQVCEDEPQPPRQLVGDIPPELERACLKALEKRQQDRYTTAADFAADLRGILSTGAGLSAPGMTPVEAPLTDPRPTPSQSSILPRPASHRVRDAERRQVTVLVCGCDLFESEPYLELDAEDQAQVLRAFQQACEQAVQPLDGAVVQCNEQGLLACFGYPVAYEDAAHRAARAGFGILEGMRDLRGQLQREHQLELDAWVGLHTGPAVVEAKDGSVSLAGEARNVGVRLDQVAATGQIVCTETTHRLIHSQFQCASLGEQKIKGVTQPVALFQVQEVGEARSPVEAAGPTGLTPLTGRDHEISLLMDRWEQAQEGMGQVVLLVGEPGLGKSRLVYTLKEHVLGQMIEGEVDAPVIEWRCSPQFQNTSLFPAIDFYERSLGFGREEPPQARFERLLSRLEKYEMARPELVPIWASLLSLPLPARYPARYRLFGSGKKHFGRCSIGCTREPPAGRFCSSSKICIGSTHRPWSFWSNGWPRACTTAS